MIKVCCCTGHRPQKFPFEYGKDSEEFNAYLQKLHDKIDYAVSLGATHFISGMALGVDLDFAEYVLKLKKTCNVTLECAVPCHGHNSSWSLKDILRCKKIIRQADEVNVISERYDSGCMFKRNRYMVDKSQMVIAVFNGEEKGGTWYTIKYAKNKNVQIEFIDL